MAGLLSDVLPYLYSQGDRAKRYMKGLLSDPVGSMVQGVNNANDRAGGLLAVTRAAAQEGALGNGPATQQLTNMLIDAYNPVGITVWHGSPHKFNKFDSSKIGTGEGKQQQGIGIYLAEAKQVGQKYADKEAWKRGMDSGYLYEVDLPDEVIAKMANHDVPFSRQPNNVKDAITPLFGDAEKKALSGYHGWENIDNAPFSAVLDSLEIARGNNRGAISKVLKEQGIPGIRYLDGGSRGAGGGTSNFVVFPGNEGLLSILERNGQPIR